MKAVCMGSLRMDKGEDLEYALASVKRMSAKNPVYYAYDIICTTEQLREANKLLPLIVKEIRESNPQLEDDNFSAGITTDFYKRPGAEPILKRLIENGDIDPKDLVMADINPDREKSWK